MSDCPIDNSTPEQQSLPTFPSTCDAHDLTLINELRLTHLPHLPDVAQMLKKSAKTPPFCSLTYDPNTMTLTYNTNISFLDPRIKPCAFTRTISRIQTKFLTLKHRDNYTFIPHKRQQAWVDNSMEMYLESIVAANEILQRVVKLYGKVGKLVSKFTFSKWGFNDLLERLELLEYLMDGFVKSFDKVTGSYTNYLETEVEARLVGTKLTDEITAKRLQLEEFEKKHFNVYRKPDIFTHFDQFEPRFILEPPRYLLLERQAGIAFVCQIDRAEWRTYQVDKRLRGLRGQQ